MDKELDKTTIMVVDDTPTNLNLLREMLQVKDYRVLAFPDGEMALSAAAKSQPDIILLDIIMPEMNGFEVCEPSTQYQSWRNPEMTTRGITSSAPRLHGLHQRRYGYDSDCYACT